MSADSPSEIVDQHYTDAAPDRDAKELVWASEQLIEQYGNATKAAERTKASSHSINKWARLGELPNDILGYLYMGELTSSSADIIRRLESSKDQRLVSIVTIEESLPKKYVRLIQKEISDNNKTAEEAIKEVIGNTASMRSVTLGFNQDTHLKLWAEAGRRQCSVAELCERLIHERMEQITGTQRRLENRVDEMDQIADEAKETADKFVKSVESINESANKLINELENERV